MNNKKIIILNLMILLTGIFGLHLTGGLEIGVSPAEVFFEGDIGERMCEEVRVFTGFGEEIFEVSDFWSLSDERKLGEHVFSSEEFGLNVRYEERVRVFGDEIVEICISGQERGKFHGIILFRELNGAIGIGSWLNVGIDNNFREEIRNIDDFERSIVLNVEEFGKNQSNFEELFVLFVGMFYLLILCVFLLVFVGSSRRKQCE